MDLQDKVMAYCREKNLITSGDKIVVGVSGGADSLTLLAILKQAAPAADIQLHLAHLNHSLRGQAADEDAEFIALLAQAWGLPCTIEKEDVAARAKANKQNPEEAARHARYEFLARVAGSVNASKIAVAHNANDQAETVLMRVIRGAGVTGLRGILPATPLDDFLITTDCETTLRHPLTVIRPLLDTPRDDIDQFCRANNLSPRIDESNRDQTFMRNRVRHELLPLLADYNPNILRSLNRTAALMAADDEVLQKESDRAWRFAVKSERPEAVTIDLQDWRVLPSAMQRQVLRRAVQSLRQNLRDIEFIHIEQAIDLLAVGRTGANLEFPHNLKLTIGYDRFILAGKSYQEDSPNLPRITDCATYTVEVPGVTNLSNSEWSIRTDLLVRRDISEDRLTQNYPWHAYFDADFVGDKPTLRTRFSGDTFFPFGLNGHRQSLKEFMINRKIPAIQRAQIPLLVSQSGRICWVCGHRTDHTCRVTPKTTRVLSVGWERL